jgi:hypothetical protein
MFMDGRAASDNVGMTRFIPALLFFLIGSVGAQAQSNWEYLVKSPERLIGLLDLPEIVAGGCGTAPNRATAPAFRAPSQNGPSLGTVYWREKGDADCGLMIEQADGSKETVPTLESGYEIPAAIVYERRGPWFRIRLNTFLTRCKVGTARSAQPRTVWPGDASLIGVEDVAGSPTEHSISRLAKSGQRPVDPHSACCKGRVRPGVRRRDGCGGMDSRVSHRSFALGVVFVARMLVRVQVA